MKAQYLSFQLYAVLTILSLFGLWAVLPARVAYAQGSEGAQSREKSSAEKGRKRRSGRSTSHKEAEGTKAADRFEADTVIKSQYRYDGEPLEVDPD